MKRILSLGLALVATGMTLAGVPGSGRRLWSARGDSSDPFDPASSRCRATPSSRQTSSGWIRARKRLYVTDRSNFGIDIIDAENNLFVGRITGFAGPEATSRGDPIANATARRRTARVQAVCS